DENHLVCSASGKVIGLAPTTGNRLWEFDGIENNTSCTPIPIANGAFLIGASSGRGEDNSGKAATNNGVIQVSKGSDGYDIKYKWRAAKASSTFGSPIVAGDSAIFVNRAGVLYRLNIETGEELATTRTSAGGIWATPLAVGDRLYLFGYKGTTSVISLTDNSELASNRCWETGEESPGFGGGSVLYAAAIAGDRLVLRRGDMIFAIGNQ
ncbi:MAG: PQQ-binding-like beta-propeller repeat protein, partial [Planctomycetota bacterium]